MQFIEDELSSHENSQSTKFAKWKSQSAQLRDKHQFSIEAGPWTTRPGVKLNGVVSTPRQHDILDLAYLMRCRALGHGCSNAEIIKGLWANPSQSLARKPWSTSLGTPTTGAELYSFVHSEGCIRCCLKLLTKNKTPHRSPRIGGLSNEIQ